MVTVCLTKMVVGALAMIIVLSRQAVVILKRAAPAQAHLDEVSRSWDAAILRLRQAVEESV